MGITAGGLLAVTAMTAVVITPAVVAVLLVATAVLAATVLPLGGLPLLHARSLIRALPLLCPRNLVRTLPLGLPLLIPRSLILALLLLLPVFRPAVFRLPIPALAVVGTLTVPLDARGVVGALPLLNARSLVLTLGLTVVRLTIAALAVIRALPIGTDLAARLSRDG